MMSKQERSEGIIPISERNIYWSKLALKQPRQAPAALITFELGCINHEWSINLRPGTVRGLVSRD